MGQGSGHCLAGSTPRECSPSSSYLRLRVLFQDIQVVGRFQFSVAVQLISLCCYCFFLVVDWVTLRNLGSWSPGLFHICCSLHGSLLFSRPGILQARILEWVAFPFFRGSSQPRDQTQVSCITDRFFTSWATRVVEYIPRKGMAGLQGGFLFIFLKLTNCFQILLYHFTLSLGIWEIYLLSVLTNTW